MEHPAKKQPKVKKYRARRLSRRTLLLILLGIAVMIAGGFVLLLPTIKETYPTRLAQSLQTEQTQETLAVGDTKVLNTITVTHDDGETYTLLYRDEQLYLQRGDDEVEMVNESYTDEIISAATEIAISDTVAKDESEVSENLADMGLNPPQISVSVNYANGEAVQFDVGGQVPGTTYHYYRWSGDNGVYMCDVGIYDAFTYTAHMLLPVEQPALVPALIDTLSITTKTAGAMACTFVSDGEDAYIGTLTEPYRYPMDNDAVTTLLSALKNFRLGTQMGEVTAENRSEYGFDDPTAILEIHQQKGYYGVVDADGQLQYNTLDEQSIHLTLGAKDGEFFYYCQYAGVCYRVSSFLVTTLVNAEAANYITHAPADMGNADIAAITAVVDGHTVAVAATYTEHVLENNEIEIDEDGNTVYDIAVTSNGQSMTTDAFDALVTRLQQMTVSGKLEGAQEPGGTPLWQLTLTTTGGVTRTLAAYHKDTFSDLLAVDGVALFYMNTEAIRIALGELYPT